MRVRYSTKHITSLAIAFLLLSLLVLPAFATTSVLDSFSGAESLTYTIESVWDDGAAYNNAQTVNATCNATATLSSLMLRMMKYGSPSATLRFDVYNSSMVLVDWSATFAASTLSAIKFMSVTKTLTQNYVCALNEALWVGCRCTAATLINYDNCVYFAVTPATRNIKYHHGIYWDTSTTRSLGFTLSGTISEKAWHDVVSWQETVQTRQWNSPATWAASLVARQWSSGTSWAANLIARTWSSGTSWNFVLYTSQWGSMALWNFNLIAESWKPITTWIFDLIPHMWHSISWDFVLTYPMNIPVLFVGFAFVFLLAIGLILYYYWEK